VRLFDIGGPERPHAATDRIVTVPNLLSAARIVVLPFVYLDLTSGRLGRALVVLLVVAASDWFDGYLARVLDQRTRLGAVLDPIGDRLGFVIIGIALVVGGLLPVWMLVVLLARELLVLLLGVLLLGTGRGIPTTSRLGKVATSGLALSMIGLVAAGALGGGAEAPLVWLRTLALLGLTFNLSLTYAATAGYARAVLSGRR
jgi:cardiolipin synthase